MCLIQDIANDQKTVALEAICAEIATLEKHIETQRTTNFTLALLGDSPSQGRGSARLSRLENRRKQLHSIVNTLTFYIQEDYNPHNQVGGEL